MHLVYLIEILVPVAFALANLETVELCACGLIVLKPLHQVLGCPGNQEIGNPQHIGIHVPVFTVIQQVERQVHHSR